MPGENDLVVLNGCVISACNYLAVMQTQHRLEPNFWAKILLVRYKDHPAGHAYCVWETEGTIYGYDRNAVPSHSDLYPGTKTYRRGPGGRPVKSVERAPDGGAGGVRRAAHHHLYRF